MKNELDPLMKDLFYIPASWRADITLPEGESVEIPLALDVYDMHDYVNIYVRVRGGCVYPIGSKEAIEH